jgi:hypothetical protein
MKTILHTASNTDKIADNKISSAVARLIILLHFFIFIYSYSFAQHNQTIKAGGFSNNNASLNNPAKLNPQVQKTVAQTLNDGSKSVWFEKNDGQFGNPAVLYGFRTAFGSMGIYKNKLRVVAKQILKDKKAGHQVIDISFPGSTKNWQVLPGSISDVKGSYNTRYGTTNATIYTELTLKNVYAGIDLRLYAGKNGDLEFDWLLQKAADHNKIRMYFKGQDAIKKDKEGNIVLALKYNDIKMVIPETYQVVNGNKKLFAASMSKAGNNNTLKYDVAGNINPGLPLVIDPVMIWSTYMHNNTSSFDEYLYTIAVNTASEVYACGLTNEAISTAYMSGVAPGFLSTYTAGINAKGDEQSVILYRLNPTGTLITAWTYTGITTNVPVAMGIFPDNRILVVYQRDTIQIFSADLTTRLYNDVLSADVGNNVLSYQSQAIVDNDVFYIGGVAESALPAYIIPASAPDAVIANNEGIILRINDASTVPYAEWGTYAGGTSNESFTAIAVTPDKTKLAFAVHADGSGSAFPALVNAVDNTFSGTELLIGVMPTGTPVAFNVFSYLGGSSDEGKSTKNQNAALVAADNNNFYIAGNTTSTDFPNTAGSAQPSHGGGPTKSNQFLCQVPLNGSAGGALKSTYNGGKDIDIVGGLVIDYRTNDVLLFGTSESADFPVYNASVYSPFYQPVHGNMASGPLDITYTVFANGLAVRKFSTFIGGAFNDYLGSTGKLEGTGHFQYNSTNGFTYIGTTIHSDQTTLPTQWMSDIPGFDKVIPTASAGKDNHYIFAMSPSTDDFGDAPASYDAVVPASSAVSFFNIRIGDEVDAEQMQNSSATANGDDNLNSGSANDEEGIPAIPSITTGATSFSVPVSVFNKTGAPVNLCGWIDSDGNGIFDTNEYTAVSIPSAAGQQMVILNFSSLPPFTSISGYSFLRLRISNVGLTSANATGAFGMGEVEDHIVLESIVLTTLLEKFTAARQDENVSVNWAAAKESNIKKYEVEYSSDNLIFTGTGAIFGAGSSHYNWIHISPVTGNNYYRLKISSTSGNITYSKVQNVKFTKNNIVTVYPNPAKDVFNIILSGNQLRKPAVIFLLSVDGKVLGQKKIPSLSEHETFDVSRYAGGAYYLKIQTGSQDIVKKVKIVNR